MSGLNSRPYTLRGFFLIAASYWIVATILMLLVFLNGCTIDSRYAAERLLWQAEKKAAALFHEREGKLQEQDIEEIIASYRQVARRAPL